MKSIHIRDVPDETVEALKRLARMHRRSLQGELKHLLERSAAFAEPPKRQRFTLNRVSVGGEGKWSREEIYEDEGR